MKKSCWAFLGATLLLAGCSHKPTIVGKWGGQVTLPGGQVVPVQSEYKEDGTETWIIGTSPKTISSSGTYILKGDMLTLTVKSVILDGHVMQGTGHEPGATETYTTQINGNTLTMNRQGVNAKLVMTRQ